MWNPITSTCCCKFYTEHIVTQYTIGKGNFGGAIVVHFDLILDPLDGSNLHHNFTTTDMSFAFSKLTQLSRDDNLEIRSKNVMPKSWRDPNNRHAARASPCMAAEDLFSCYQFKWLGSAYKCYNRPVHKCFWLITANESGASRSWSASRQQNQSPSVPVYWT